MFRLDCFWDDVVEEGLIGLDQAGRARTRHAQVGGGLDTAILEVVALSAHEINRLLDIASKALGYEMAHVEYIDAPDLEYLARLPRALVEKFGILPSRNFAGALVLVIPPLAPHACEEMKRGLLEYTDLEEVPLLVGLESDIREALRRFSGIALPQRFDALWTGLCPSVASRSTHHLGPLPQARSSEGIDCMTSDSLVIPFSSSVCETDDHLLGSLTGSHVTRPGRPTALSLADTGEFSNHHLASNRPAPVNDLFLIETENEVTVVTQEISPEHPSTDSSTNTLKHSTPDTLPP